MTIKLLKDAIDLGIVTVNPAACVAFYRDVLGLRDRGQTPMPGGTMHRLDCGNSRIKIIAMDKDPRGSSPPGGLRGGTGYRYWTISVSNLTEVLDACEAAGHRVVVPPREIRPGVTIAMVEDPDGNWVELLSERS